MTTATVAVRRKKKMQPGTIGRGIGIAVILIAFIAPLLWMLTASFKSNVDIYDSSKTFSFTPTLQNYDTVFGQAQYGSYIWNSFYVAAMATALSLVLAVPAAYAMSRFVMNRSAMVVLLARIIPGVSLLVPWYFVFSRMGLVGSYTVLILSDRKSTRLNSSHVASSYAVFCL